MTLFTLLLVMAIERVTQKSKQFHISAITGHYFTVLIKQKCLRVNASMMNCVFIALLPALLIWLAIYYLPGIIVLIIYLFSLWICLGCPQTRKVYKRYLQAAGRGDTEACAIHSDAFANEVGDKNHGDLSRVADQLVVINYRHYASVIIMFILLGVPGMIFYAVMSELSAFQAQRRSVDAQDNAASIAENNQATHQNSQNQNSQNQNSQNSAEKLLFFLDIIPSRITALGFLVVGHFSRGLSVWLETCVQFTLSPYDILTKVAKASEVLEPSDKPYLDAPMQMVKLVKRNIIFFLMVISILTLVGLVA